MERDIEQSRNAGMNEHLAKPIDDARLFDAISRYFETNITSKDDSNLKIKNEIIQIDGADIDGFIEDLDITPTRAYKMYADFMHNFEQLLLDFDLISSNQNQLKTSIHSLKGVSGNLRISSIHKLAKEIERDGYPKESLDALRSALERLFGEIRETIVPFIKKTSQTLFLSDQDGEYKVQIRNKAKQKYTCNCGSICSIENKAKHERSQKHQAFIQSLSVAKNFDVIHSSEGQVAKNCEAVM
jgi:HPt (histidine-containing phosphotransfer) domain-containing protein